MEIDGLDQMVVKTRFPGAALDLGITIARNRNDQGIGTKVLPELFRDFIAVHAGESDIEEHRVGAFIGSRGNRV